MPRETKPEREARLLRLEEEARAERAEAMKKHPDRMLGFMARADALGIEYEAHLPEGKLVVDYVTFHGEIHRDLSLDDEPWAFDSFEEHLTDVENSRKAKAQSLQRAKDLWATFTPQQKTDLQDNFIYLK